MKITVSRTKSKRKLFMAEQMKKIYVIS